MFVALPHDQLAFLNMVYIKVIAALALFCWWSTSGYVGSINGTGGEGKSNARHNWPIIMLPTMLLVSRPTPTLPHVCHYYCAIAEGRVWAGSTGFCVLCRNVGRPIRLQEQFVVNELLWCCTYHVGRAVLSLLERSVYIGCVCVAVWQGVSTTIDKANDSCFCPLRKPCVG